MTSSLTVRIDSSTHRLLHQMAKQFDESMQTVLSKAVELYRQEHFLMKCNDAYLALKKNPKAWQDELDERKAWEAAGPDNTE